jgi:hypothetical protein
MPLGGDTLGTRSLLSATEESLVGLLGEVVAGLEVPVLGVVSDGQHPIRRAVARVLPGVPINYASSTTCVSSQRSLRG